MRLSLAGYVYERIRRDDERAAMDRLPSCEIVEEEINCVDMNRVRLLDVPEYGQGDRVARRAEIRNSCDFDVVQVVDRGQVFSLRYIEQPPSPSSAPT
jgi:hypothetical protein